jgi:hypothetical protein
MDVARYSTADILEQLDEHARAYTFPVLDNVYIALADVHLTGYRDEQRWALVIEVLGDFTRTEPPESLENTLYVYGNCLLIEPGIGPSFQSVLDNDPGRPAFRQQDKENWHLVARDAEVVLIRGQRVPIPRDPAAYAAIGVLIEPGEGIHCETLLRVLAPKYRDLLFATEEELRRCVPADLPVIIRLDEWCHPTDFDEEPPSANPTFRQIADVLATGDPNRYLEPEVNTPWSNWPRGGRG